MTDCDACQGNALRPDGTECFRCKGTALLTCNCGQCAEGEVIAFGVAAGGRLEPEHRTCHRARAATREEAKAYHAQVMGYAEDDAAA